MATPFDADGALDLDGAATLARWLVAHGNDGLSSPAPPARARPSPTRRRSTCGGPSPRRSTVPWWPGPGPRHRPLGAAGQGGGRAGVAGILAVTPYYNRPSQAGIEAHVRAVGAAAGACPVLPLRHPGAHRPARLDADTICRLAADGVDRRRQGRHRRPGGARRGSSPAPRRVSSSTAAMTPTPSPCSPSAPWGSSRSSRTGPARRWRRWSPPSPRATSTTPGRSTPG